MADSGLEEVKRQTGACPTAQQNVWRRTSNEENRRQGKPCSQKCADPTGRRNETVAGETIRVCLMSVHYDQHPEDREAETQADSSSFRFKSPVVAVA
jgi:hypothetical protein